MRDDAAEQGPDPARDLREVTGLVGRYGTAIDTRDWVLFGGVFAERIDVDYGQGIGRHSEGDEFTAFVQRFFAGAGSTMHRMTDTVLTSSEGTLSARSYGDAIVLDAGDRTGTRVAAVYDDSFVRQDGVLRISRRYCRVVLVQPIAENLAAER